MSVLDAAGVKTPAVLNDVLKTGSKDGDAETPRESKPKSRRGGGGLPPSGPYAMSSAESLSFLTSSATFDSNGRETVRPSSSNCAADRTRSPRRSGSRREGRTIASCTSTRRSAKYLKTPSP